MARHAFPALGFDPVPGDPETLLGVSRRLGRLAADLDQDAELLDTARGSPLWEGQAAEAFADEAVTLVADLRRASHAYGGCGQALSAYARVLVELLPAALAEEREAEVARARAARLDGEVEQAQRAVASAEEGRAAPAGRYELLAGRHAAALDAYQEAVARARRLHARAQAAARRAAEQVRGLSDAPYHEPGLWDRASSWVASTVSDIGGAVDRWVDEHAGLLRSISGVLKTVSAVAGVLSLVPVLAPVMAPVALATGGAALTIDATLVATGNGDWKAVAVDAGLMLIPGVGRVLGRVMKGAAPAIRGGMGSLRRGAVAFTRRVVRADPVDVASGDVVLAQTDVELPGVLPLVLSRVHVSSYRVGRWFGRSWASTLDQRLEVDRDGVCYAAADGMLLVYPHPAAEPVPPVEGPRLLLARADCGYTVTDPERGLTLHFRPGGTLQLTLDATILPLSAISDRNGNRIDLDYDASGMLVGVRHSGGYRLAVDTSGGHVAALRLLDPGGGAGQLLVSYDYDDGGRLVGVRDAGGEPLRLDYDADGRLAGWADRNDTWYRYRYDEHGRCVEASGSGGYLDARFAYDAKRRVTTVTDALGHATSYQLNEADQVVLETDPLGNSTALAWDRADQLLERTDPLGRTTRWSYDGDGNLTEVTRPDGSRMSTSYDGLGLPLTVTEPDEAVWRFAYDHRGNPVARTDPSGATTTFAYDERGGLTAVTDVLGNTSQVDCDPAGLPVAVTDPLGATTRYRRDLFGRVAEVTDPLGGAVRLAWTMEGKLARRELPDGAMEQWSYDGEGNLIEHTDAAGAVTRIEIGSFDLPVARTGPDGVRLAYEYDTELRLVAVTNPHGLVWRYRYDVAGNLVGETDFDGRTLTYRYDAAPPAHRAGQRRRRAGAAGPGPARQRHRGARRRAAHHLRLGRGRAAGAGRQPGRRAALRAGRPRQGRRRDLQRAHGHLHHL